MKDDAPVLTVAGAQFSYPGRAVLAGLDLTIARREIVVLIGRNGAGKSTLLRALSGRIALSGGSVTISGEDPRRSAAARAAAGFVPQRIAVYERLSVRENLAAFADVMAVPRDRRTRRIDGILGFIRLTDRQHERAARLSGGMRRRLNIGMALVHLPRLLVLDEPTAGLDVEGRAALVDVLRALKARGMSVLLVTHDMDEADALADRVALMAGGRILAEGAPATLVAKKFGTHQALSVEVAAGEPEDSSLSRRLAAFGLVRDKSGLWAGIVAESAAAAAARLVADEPQALAIHIRRPGLDALLAALSAESAS